MVCGFLLQVAGQLAFFFLLWAFAARHYIPKDLHPQAVAALVTAILFWIVVVTWRWLRGIRLFEDMTVGWATACTFMSVLAVILALGDNGCGAGLLIAIPPAVYLVRWWVIDVASVETSDDGRVLVGVMTILALLLSTPAHFLGW